MHGVNLPGWRWAGIKQLALVGSSSSLHSEACKALGGSDGVVHSTISLAAICMRAVAKNIVVVMVMAMVVLVVMVMVVVAGVVVVVCIVEVGVAVMVVGAAVGISGGSSSVGGSSCGSTCSRSARHWGQSPAKIKEFTLLRSFHGNL